MLASLGYQIAIVAFASYAAWLWLVNRYAASRLAVFTFLTPVFGVAAGYVILGEPADGMLLSALALIAMGIWLVNRARNPPNQGALTYASGRENQPCEG